MAKKILIPIQNLYEDLELQYPRYRLLEAGAEVIIAGPKKEETYQGKHGYPCKSEASFSEINPASLDGIVIPGGYAPDKLRTEKKLLEIIQDLHKNKKLIAFICHAGWLPISAGILKGVDCTSYHSIKDDMMNAGAKWRDEKVVVDGHLISSRTPADLPHYSKAILDFLSL